MAAVSVLPFVGMIVGSCILGGAIYAGLARIARAIEGRGGACPGRPG